MRFWIARIFLLSAFSLLMAHNLVAHVHLDEQVVAHHHEHDEDRDGQNHPVVFGHLDHSFFKSTEDLSFVKQLVATVVNSVDVFPSYEKVIWPSQSFELLPPDSPPHLVFLGAAGLRGPPVC